MSKKCAFCASFTYIMYVMGNIGLIDDDPFSSSEGRSLLSIIIVDLGGQVGTMEPSAVRAARASSSAASASSWATPVGGRATVRSPSCTATAASTAVCRSVSPSACAQNVSISLVPPSSQLVQVRENWKSQGKMQDARSLFAKCTNHIRNLL